MELKSSVISLKFLMEMKRNLSSGSVQVIVVLKGLSSAVDWLRSRLLRTADDRDEDGN